jgi:3-oxoadipate enol-lactonase
MGSTSSGRPLPRQFVGRDGRRHLAALYPDHLNRAVLINCMASKTVVATIGAVCGHGVVGGGAGRDPAALTGSSIRAFLGPTTPRTRPDVVGTLRTNVQSVHTDSVRWPVRSVISARPDQHALLPPSQRLKPAS